MSTNKLLTLVIPTYNMEAFLSECLSTLIVGKEYMDLLEVLIVIDGSRDRSAQIGQEFANLYPDTFRVIVKTNGNYGSCVNRGIDEARGKYIKTLDADDKFQTEHLSLFLDHLLTHDADMVISDYAGWNMSTGQVENFAYDLPTTDTFGIDKMNFTVDAPLTMHAVAYRTSVLRDMNYRQSEGISYTDQEWIFMPIVGVKTVTHFPHILYIYRLGRAGQTVDINVWVRHANEEIFGLKRMAEFYKNEKDKVSPEAREFLLTRLKCRTEATYRHIFIRSIGSVDESIVQDLDTYVAENIPEIYPMPEKAMTYHGINIIGMWRRHPSLYKAYLSIRSFANKAFKAHRSAKSSGSTTSCGSAASAAPSPLLSPQTTTASEDAETPEVSIAIPVYNVEDYIEKSMLSALNQNFAYPFEILVIDDCGTDRSIDIVKHLMTSHSRGHCIRILRQEKNTGPGLARNIALEQARGKYFYFLDSDDLMAPNCLSHLHTLAEENHADFVVGSSDQIEKEFPSPRYNLDDQIIRKDAAGVHMFVHDIFMNIEVWNKLYRMDFLRRNNIRTTHPIMEDSIFDFHLRALAKVIVLSSEVTYFYNVREGSIMTSRFGHEASDETIAIYCDIIHQVQKLIREKYHDIEGIYDLYGLRLAYSFYSFKQIKITPSQEKYIDEQMKGFNTFIPSMHILKLGIFRYAYLKCKLTGEDWRTFGDVYAERYTRKKRIIAWIFSWL